MRLCKGIHSLLSHRLRVMIPEAFVTTSGPGVTQGVGKRRIPPCSMHVRVFLNDDATELYIASYMIRGGVLYENPIRIKNFTKTAFFTAEKTSLIGKTVTPPRQEVEVEDHLIDDCLHRLADDARQLHRELYEPPKRRRRAA